METLQSPDPGHEVAQARVQGHHGLAPGPQQGGGEAAPPGPLCTPPAVTWPGAGAASPGCPVDCSPHWLGVRPRLAAARTQPAPLSWCGRSGLGGGSCNIKLIYRMAGLSCPEAGVCLSAILRGFPDVFSLLGPCKVGEISFRTS